MQVPLLDLKAQYQQIKPEVDAAVLEVLASQYFILGPKVQACEEQIADYCQCPAGIGVASGSDALLISLMAAEIGQGDEVITSTFTFFATGGAIARAGAKPVFVDIDPESYNLDVTAIEAAVTPATRAIMPVHLYGQMAEMDPILEIARQHDLLVIEDAAQAIGAEYKGQRAGSLGDYGCFSFFPSKNLGGGGDGGMVTVRDEAKAEHLRVLRVHGMEPKYYHRLVGGNFRFDAMQAAIISVKLPYLDGWTEARQRNAARYNALFEELAVAGDLVRTPVELPARRHIYNQYVIRVPRRDELRQHLLDNGIGCEVYYPVPLHLQECFAYLGYGEGDFPVSEQAAAETLALPVYPEMNDDQLNMVASTIAQFLLA